MPLVAALGGVLYMKPEGHSESKSDALHLSTDLEFLKRQQGYMRAQPSTDGASMRRVPPPDPSLPAGALRSTACFVQVRFVLCQ